MKKDLSREEILEWFDYDKENGKLYWKKSKKHSKVKPGDEAGCLDKNGYRIIKFNYKIYYVHRLIWIIEHGENDNLIDHKDRNPQNNRINNLRVATNSQNQVNSVSKNMLKGMYKGVYKTNRKSKPYHVAIKVKGKSVFLGSFSESEEAALAYNNAALQHFGEYANLNQL